VVAVEKAVAGEVEHRGCFPSGKRNARDIEGEVCAPVAQHRPRCFVDDHNDGAGRVVDIELEVRIDTKAFKLHAVSSDVVLTHPARNRTGEPR